jgi:hypothetical protein
MEIKEIERLENQLRIACNNPVSYAGSSSFIELDLEDAKKIKKLVQRVKRFEKKKIIKSSLKQKTNK